MVTVGVDISELQMLSGTSSSHPKSPTNYEIEGH